MVHHNLETEQGFVETASETRINHGDIGDDASHCHDSFFGRRE
jgi:hypothetical protein